jgi:hypothetical protein
MIHPRRSFVPSSHWALFSILLADLSIEAGCGNFGDGSVVVSSESRARILPHINMQTRNAKVKPAASQPKSANQLVRQNAAP